MTKAKHAMKEGIRLVDLIIEVMDTRMPFSSKNPDIDELGQNKARIVPLNKSDLSSERQNDAWTEWSKSQDRHIIKVSSRSGAGLKQINSVVQETCKEKIERNHRRGILNRPVWTMVVRIPNVGRSISINSLTDKACTKTDNKPGTTKGNQWIRLNKSLELLDTPGILWPRFGNREVGLHLAFTGSINDEILSKEEMAVELPRFIMESCHPVMEERYQIEGEGPYRALKQIAGVRSCLAKGRELDVNKAANLFVDDSGSERLGRVTLESPPAEEA